MDLSFSDCMLTDDSSKIKGKKFPLLGYLVHISWQYLQIQVFLCRISFLTIFCSLEKASYVVIFSLRSAVRSLPPPTLWIYQYTMTCWVLCSLLFFYIPFSSSHIGKTNGRSFIFSHFKVFFLLLLFFPPAQNNLWLVGVRLKKTRLQNYTVYT
jgi:hypothetical protein